MKLKIELTMDNAAFDGNAGHEAGRILRELGTDLSRIAGGEDMAPFFPMKLRDLNGNTVGLVTLKE